jgi:cysteine-rich repeat protein
VAGSETMGTSTGTSTSTTDATGTADDHSAPRRASTGEPVPTCGNGALEAFGAVPEECDDGNLDPDDGCSDTCALDRHGCS